MDKKIILLTTIIFPERLEWLLKYLENNFGINKKNVFVYKILGDESKIIATFKISIERDKKIDIKNTFPNPIIIHKRGEALYTINALNKIIEKESDIAVGNIDYSNFSVDWSKYQNNLITTSNNELIITPIKRIF